MDYIIHKRGDTYTEKYIGFGQYELVYGPLCVGIKMLYKGYSYPISDDWSDVTCKHCLAKLRSMLC